MKLLATAAAGVCLAVIAVVAAPALSSTQWRPEPVDFALAPATQSASQALRPGKHFNLVGMRWRGGGRPAVKMRTRLGDGRWTPWVEVSEYTEDAPDPGRGEPEVHGLSMPVWVGEADQVQYRLSRPVPGLRLHFVNVLGTTTAADRLRTRLRRAANVAVASVAGLFRGRSAEAAEPKPAIKSRKSWDPHNKCPPRQAPDYGVVKAAFIHHTVSANDYSRDEVPSIILGICDYHRNSNGWNDIGYNFLVDKYGTTWEGRAGGEDQAVVGAQAQGYNAQSTGIANLGTFSSVQQTPAALSAIARLIRWKLPLSGVPTSGSTTLVSAGGETNKYSTGTHVRVKRVSGHRDVDATECPGNALYAQLPQLRQMVGNLPAAGAGTSLQASLSDDDVGYKRSSRFSGRLGSFNGAPLGGETVRAQVRRGRRWKTLKTLLTGSDGSFSVVMHSRINRTMRARFSGQGDLVAASSPTVRLRVRTQLKLAHPPERGRKSRRVRFRGTVAPRKKTVWQVLAVQRDDGTWKRVGVRKLKARRGRFRGSFVPDASGQFRYYVTTRPDSSNARGRSAKVVIRVR
ncbi:MAG TPA: peptidoglycan recognition protein [Thermoleophilaceae bacterium]